MCPLFFSFFFNLPSVGTRTNCRTVFFSFFFGSDEDFWGMLTKNNKTKKTKNKKLPFLPHHKTRKLTVCDKFKQRYIELSGFGFCVMFFFLYTYILVITFRIVSSANLVFSFQYSDFFYLLVNTIFGKILNNSCMMDKTSRNFLRTQQNVTGLNVKFTVCCILIRNIFPAFPDPIHIAI
jgi:hypothetical protein